MATYDELLGAAGDSGLVRKVRVACIVAAEGIRNNGSATAAEKAWARRAFTDPEDTARQMMWACLAANRNNTLGQILGATDAQIQTVVDAAVSLFAE